MAENFEEVEAGYEALGSEVAEIADKLGTLILRATELEFERERLVDDRVLPIILANGADTFERTDEIETLAIDASLPFRGQVLMLRQLLAGVEGTDPEDGVIQLGEVA